MTLQSARNVAGIVAVFGLPLFSAAVMALDLWLYRRFGTEATISAVTLAAARRHPILAVAVPSTLCLWIGLLIGHLFMPQYRD